jgi:hypothetical protein
MNRLLQRGEGEGRDRSSMIGDGSAVAFTLRDEFTPPKAHFGS